jgi:hypothetical protein
MPDLASFSLMMTPLQRACAAAALLWAQGSAGADLAIDNNASASTKRAADCSFEAVQAALLASRPGDTLAIPPGDCDWGAKQLTLPAGIKLRGAGRELTSLRRTAVVPPNIYLVRIDCRSGGKAVFSDITLVGANLPESAERGLGLINGCVDFVVANARFTRFVFAGVEVRGAAIQRGVIHGSQFINNYNHAVHNLGYGIVVFGDGSWPALELGSENAVFVEDNYFFGNRHHIASNNGSRYVFRRNIAVASDLTKDFWQVDAHGLSSAARGSRSWEIYDNRFSATLSKGRNLAAIGLRGGDGVVYDNTFAPAIAHPVLLLLEGARCGSAPGKDQIRAAHIAERPGAVVSTCPASVKLQRDYFLGRREHYQPYVYPHPLRRQ